MLTELKKRGLQDILIACVDGLKGFPDAINSVFPQTHIQLCIIHMVRNNLKYVAWKDYKAVTIGSYTELLTGSSTIAFNVVFLSSANPMV